MSAAYAKFAQAMDFGALRLAARSYKLGLGAARGGRKSVGALYATQAGQHASLWASGYSRAGRNAIMSGIPGAGAAFGPNYWMGAGRVAMAGGGLYMGYRGVLATKYLAERQPVLTSFGAAGLGYAFYRRGMFPFVNPLVARMRTRGAEAIAARAAARGVPR